MREFIINHSVQIYHTNARPFLLEKVAMYGLVQASGVRHLPNMDVALEDVHTFPSLQQLLAMANRA